MKVYVDELPKSCDKCPFHCKTLLFAENHIENAVYKTDCRLGFTWNCRLQSLADQDKQVRKQVCDEIYNKCEPLFRLVNNYDNGDVIERNELVDILEQIEKGE